jgi:hypothetical protein
MIETFGKGALPDLPDSRDFKAAPVLAALPPVNWNIPFQLPDPGNEDQGTSESCVAQSTSYYHVQLHPADYSRRDLYCRIFQPEGGAYLRDGVAAIVSAGQATRDVMPDPQPQTEAGMRDKTGLNPQAEAAHEELTYNSVEPDIDSIAQAIANFKGCIFGVIGTNQGWTDIANPRPPASGEAKWGHALYGMGYHMHDGLKCIIAKSSWCSTGIYQHHIKENYFESGNTYSAWTLIPKDQQMQFFQVSGEATIVALLNGKYREIATDAALFPYVKQTLGIPDTLQSVDRATVNANLGKQIVAGITF